MNKIEVRYNIVPPTCPWQLTAFELVLIFVFYFRIQKRKVLRLSYALYICSPSSLKELVKYMTVILTLSTIIINPILFEYF